MKKQLNSVKEFHDTYKLGYSDKPLANLGNDKNERALSRSIVDASTSFGMLVRFGFFSSPN